MSKETGFKNTPIIAAGYRAEIGAETTVYQNFLDQLMNGAGDKQLFRSYREGYSEKSFEDIKKKFEEAGGKLVNCVSMPSTEEFTYMWRDKNDRWDAFVNLGLSKTKMITIDVSSFNPEISKLAKEYDSYFSAPVKKGYIFAIVRDSQGKLKISRIGYAGTPLEKENYTDKVIEDYEYAIEDLKSPTPSGRIVILDGPPGGGKSFLTRGIINDVPDSMLVVVPPEMVASIGGPDLLPLLLKIKEDYGSKKNSIVLILEDADACLAPRASDNMSSISSILNFGDGIFGSLFDIRIIATTNQMAKEFDRAIMRPGRLSKRIHISPLPYTKANKIYQRLLNDDKKSMVKPEVKKMGFAAKNDVQEDFTLAEVYFAARENGWKPEPAAKVELVEDPNDYEKRFAEFDDMLSDEDLME
jgi:hypothetical protein